MAGVCVGHIQHNILSDTLQPRQSLASPAFIRQMGVSCIVAIQTELLDLNQAIEITIDGEHYCLDASVLDLMTLSCPATLQDQNLPSDLGLLGLPRLGLQFSPL